MNWCVQEFFQQILILMVILQTISNKNDLNIKLFTSTTYQIHTETRKSHSAEIQNEFPFSRSFLWLISSGKMRKILHIAIQHHFLVILSTVHCSYSLCILCGWNFQMPCWRIALPNVTYKKLSNQHYSVFRNFPNVFFFAL